MLQRRQDWPRRLADFYTATRGDAFAWSTQDCAAWPLRAIDAMCGTDFAGPMAGAYATFEEGEAYCAARGWATLADAAREIGCIELILPTLAQRGDIVFLPPRAHAVAGERHIPTLGVLFLNVDGSLYEPFPDGMLKYPLTAVARAGGVGFAVGRPV